MDTLEGQIKRVLYDHGDESGFRICELKTGDGTHHTIVGSIIADVGDSVQLDGFWDDNKQYGRQFRVKSLTLMQPRGALGILGFLDRIPNIGPIIARAIYDEFGDTTFEVIENNPDTLARVRGISGKMTWGIHDAYMLEKANRDLIVFLKEFEITDNKIAKIMHRYGSRLEDVLKNSPYTMIEEIDGFGFKTVDDIAMRAGMAKDSEERIWAAIIHTMNQAEGIGHTYVPVELLIHTVCSAIKVPRAKVEAIIKGGNSALTLTEELSSKKKSRRVAYKYKLHAMEKSIAKNLHSLMAQGEMFR